MLSSISIIQTEKAISASSIGFYTFKISKSLNKIQIKNYIEKLFSVKIKFINTTNYSQKVRTFKGISGHSSSYKKCFVKLVSGYSIDLSQGESLKHEAWSRT